MKNISISVLILLIMSAVIYCQYNQVGGYGTYGRRFGNNGYNNGYGNRNGFGNRNGLNSGFYNQRRGGYFGNYNNGYNRGFDDGMDSESISGSGIGRRTIGNRGQSVRNIDEANANSGRAENSGDLANNQS